MEPRELVPSQHHLRPADILTAAARRLTAVDMGVTSPSTATSSEQAKTAMVVRKTGERTDIDSELSRQGVEYTPMVAGHFGSLHGFLDQWIRDLARALSRRKGFARTALEKQIRNRLGAALARRAARMSLATYPKSNDLNGIALPIVDYDDLDRAVDHASCTHTRVSLTRQEVHEPRWSGAASGGTARYPAWDTGR